MTRVFGTAPIVATVIGGLVAVDCLAGRWRRRHTDARLLTKTRTDRVGRLIVVFPGLGMPCASVAEAFAPHVSDDDALIVVEYADRGVDVADIGRLLAAEIERLRPTHLRIYGASMGGMCAAGFLSNFRPMTHRPEETVLLLDTAPNGLPDVRLRSLAFVVRWYRGGPISSLIWRLLCQVYPYAPSEEGVDRAMVRSAHRRYSATGMPTLTSQADFVTRFSVGPSKTWATEPDHAVFLRGFPAGGDPLVEVDSAVAAWARILPRLEVVGFPQRPDSWHVPIVERPRETMTMILGA